LANKCLNDGFLRIADNDAIEGIESVCNILQSNQKMKETLGFIGDDGDRYTCN
jgi:hypothetical protein